MGTSAFRSEAFRHPQPIADVLTSFDHSSCAFHDGYETGNIIQRLLTKTIKAKPSATALDILRWTANASVRDYDETDDYVRP